MMKKVITLIIISIIGIVGLYILGNIIWKEYNNNTVIVSKGYCKIFPRRKECNQENRSLLAFKTQQAQFDCNKIRGITAEDCEGLKKLYENMGGPNRTNKQGWLTDYDAINWYGINLKRSPKIYLGLHNNNLVGNAGGLNVSIPNLEGYYLGANPGINGSLPTNRSLPSLVYMDLKHSNINGNIPEFVGLPNLGWLNVSYTKVNGNFPNFTNTPKLYALDAEHTDIVGEVPSSRGKLFGLQRLVINNNKLCGLLPDWMNNKYFHPANLNIEKNNLLNNRSDYEKKGKELLFDWAINNFRSLYDQTPKNCGDPDPICGNGEKEGSEQCDDGNNIDDDYCANSCETRRINCNDVNFTIDPIEAEPMVKRTATWKNQSGLYYHSIEWGKNNKTNTPSPTVYDQLIGVGTYTVSILFTTFPGYGETFTCSKKVVVKKPKLYSCNKSSYSCEVDENGIYGQYWGGGEDECAKQCYKRVNCNTNAIRKPIENCPSGRSCSDVVYGDDITKHPSYNEMCFFTDKANNKNYSGPPTSVRLDPQTNEWIITCEGEGPDSIRGGNGAGFEKSCSMKVMRLFCGDGVKNGPEECDDGNKQNSDGCTTKCEIGSTRTYDNEGDNGTKETIGKSLSDHRAIDEAIYDSPYKYYSMPKVYNPSSIQPPKSSTQHTSITIIKE